MRQQTLNQKIEAAWAEYRKGGEGLSVAEKRVFTTRFIHLAADRFDTDLERVRQRIAKMEKNMSEKDDGSTGWIHDCTVKDHEVWVPGVGTRCPYCRKYLDTENRAGT